MRRKAGGLVPLEIAICAAAATLRRGGEEEFHGYEMAKASIALTLSKEYCQDEALDWGYLTVPEESHRLRKASS